MYHCTKPKFETKGQNSCKRYQESPTEATYKTEINRQKKIKTPREMEG
jgi:hypothetical protein